MPKGKQDPCTICKVAFIPFDPVTGRTIPACGSCCSTFPDPSTIHTRRPMYIMLDDEHVDKLDVVEKAVKDYFCKDNKSDCKPDNFVEPKFSMQSSPNRPTIRQTVDGRPCCNPDDPEKGNRKCDYSRRGEVVKPPKPKYREAKFSEQNSPNRHPVKQTLDGKTCDDPC